VSIGLESDDSKTGEIIFSPKGDVMRPWSHQDDSKKTLWDDFINAIHP
jgi:hypothetical protein